MTNNEQLDQLVSHFAKGLKADFARMLGITKQSLHSWYTHNHLDVGKIYMACPGVSVDWLITGEGAMLKTDRPPVLQEGERLIPLLKEQDLLDGKWDNLDNFNLLRTGKPQPDIDFLSRMPNDNLATTIAAGDAIGCKIRKTDEFQPGMHYILRTANNGTFFVVYKGKKGKINPVHDFMTSRINGQPDLHLTIPSEDSIQAAQITGTTRKITSNQTGQ